MSEQAYEVIIIGSGAAAAYALVKRGAGCCCWKKVGSYHETAAAWMSSRYSPTAVSKTSGPG